MSRSPSPRGVKRSGSWSPPVHKRRKFSQSPPRRRENSSPQRGRPELEAYRSMKMDASSEDDVDRWGRSPSPKRIPRPPSPHRDNRRSDFRNGRSPPRRSPQRRSPRRSPPRRWDGPRRSRSPPRRSPRRYGSPRRDSQRSPQRRSPPRQSDTRKRPHPFDNSSDDEGSRVPYRPSNVRRDDANQRQFDEQRNRNDRNREQNYERRREAFVSNVAPPLHSIHRGEVMNIQSFGVFVKLPTGQQGLVHISQISQRRITAEELRETVAVREQVWVKVIRNESDDDDRQAKISLSMKYVSQLDGVDLDPTNAQLQLQEDRMRRPGGFGPAEGFELQAVLNTRCTRCGTQGHFAADCYNIGKTSQYELIQEDELPDHTEVKQPPPSMWQEKTVETKSKKDKKSKDKHKKHKKEKKSKKDKKHKDKHK